MGAGWQLNDAFSTEISTTEPEAQEEAASAEALNLDLFWDVYGEVESDYFDLAELTSEDQIYGAIRGLVESMEDPYSVFMTPEETTEFNQSLNGELEGIGAELTVKDGKLVIVSPLKDSPAEEAGLLPGDHVYAVNGEPTSEMTLFEAIMTIRGERGTQVTLTILRDGLETAMEIVITRDKIFVPSIELTYEESAGKTLAHLAVYQFADDTYNEFKTAVRDVLLKNPDGLILDMRLNGGGYLDVSVQMLSEFFEDEVKAVIVKRRSEENDVTYTKGAGQLPDIPMVVLIDEGSASAAEIVAGALKDHGRAVVMGEQSFGKGSVQELTSLKDGSSLRLTIAKWFTPNDTSIDEVGIAPDIVVPMETSALDTEEDTQLKAAVDYLLKL